MSDRTHLAALNSTVTATYAPAGGAAMTSAGVVRGYGTVTVPVTVLREAAGGAGVVTAAQAADLVLKANEQYAQVGLRLAVSGVQTIDPPAGVNLANGLDDFVATAGKEYFALFDAKVNGTPVRTPATDDIELYFVNKLGSGNRGEAFVASVFPGVMR